MEIVVGATATLSVVRTGGAGAGGVGSLESPHDAAEAAANHRAHSVAMVRSFVALRRCIVRGNGGRGATPR